MRGDLEGQWIDRAAARQPVADLLADQRDLSRKLNTRIYGRLFRGRAFTRYVAAGSLATAAIAGVVVFRKPPHAAGSAGTVIWADIAIFAIVVFLWIVNGRRNTGQIETIERKLEEFPEELVAEVRSRMAAGISDSARDIIDMLVYVVMAATGISFVGYVTHGNVIATIAAACVAIVALFVYARRRAWSGR